MKKIITAALFCFASSFAQEATILTDNTQKPVVEQKIPGTGMQNAGQILMITGIPLTVLGIAIASSADYKCESTSTSTSSGQQCQSQDASAPIGILMAVVGVPAAITGIVLYSVGTSKINRYKAKHGLSSLELDFQPKLAASQYIGLKYSF